MSFQNFSLFLQEKSLQEDNIAFHVPVPALTAVYIQNLYCCHWEINSGLAKNALTGMSGMMKLFGVSRIHAGPSDILRSLSKAVNWSFAFLSDTWTVTNSEPEMFPEYLMPWATLISANYKRQQNAVKRGLKFTVIILSQMCQICIFIYSGTSKKTLFASYFPCSKTLSIRISPAWTKCRTYNSEAPICCTHLAVPTRGSANKPLCCATKNGWCYCIYQSCLPTSQLPLEKCLKV